MKSTKKSFLMSLISLILCFLMLTGTTWAWFTDVVTSDNNVIQAGSLDISLEHTDVKTEDPDSTNWIDASTGAIFTYENWEPGFAMVKYVKIENEGSLDLKFMLNILPELAAIAGEVNLADVIEVYMAEGAVDLTRDMLNPESDLFVGNLSSIMGKSGGAASGNLDSGEYEIYTLALKMSEEAGNEYQELSVGGSFTLKLIATQRTSESDSFGPDYDEGAQWPELPEESTATSPITLNADGTLAAPVTFANNEGTISITLPAGTKFKQGTANANLNVNKLAQSGANITLEENEETRSFDVHVKDLADDNSAVISIAIKEFLPVGLNMGNYKLYHVEDTATVEMTLLGNGETPVHNSFNYDPATGDVVLHLASFSEVALVADTENAWKGEFDYSWYDASKTDLQIANADQLAAFGAIVGGMKKVTGRNDDGTYTYSDDVIQDSFAGKTVKLISDINLGDDEENNVENKIFYPIGYWNQDGTYEKSNKAISSGFYNFCGTFDGNGNTISNFYQNTWEMKGDHNWYDASLQYYRDGMGLFGKVYGGTVKNLTVNNFSSDGEIATTGVIAAYADGATFENIAIFNCNPRVYNIGNGGIVGCVGWYAKEADLKTTFKNITVDNTNKISALWGSYDVACGGIVGQYYPTSGQSSVNYPVNAGIHFENCHVAAQMDVYNDVCANYQYYAYRYTGMLIGSVRENETIDGHSYPKMDGITAKDCTVHFGTWNDYYYCEIIDNTTASYTHDYQMSRLTEIKAINGTTITYLDGTTGTVPASGRANYVIVDYSKGHGTENATCYHFKDGAVWNHEDAGYHDGENGEKYIDENGDGKADLKEDKQHIYLEFNNLVTGYGWGVTTKGVGDLAGVTILDREVADSVDKFKPVIDNNNEFPTESTVKIGDLFAAIENAGVDIKYDNVQVAVSPFGATSTAGGTYAANTTDWTKGTITFSGIGTAVITITDYYFCKTATVIVNVVGAEKFETKFVNYNEYLYRVGNADKSTVALGTIFKHNGEGTINSASVGVTFTTVAGNASGTFTANTSDWTKGTIQFTGTGVVKVTIKDNTSKEFELYLEVVDAVNATGATNATSNNVVLLNDIGGGFTVSNGYAFYGNGFKVTCSGKGYRLNYAGMYGGFIEVTNGGVLDNVQVFSDIYPVALLYSSEAEKHKNEDVSTAEKTYYNYQLSAVAITGNGSMITNSYIYGGRNNIYVGDGNVSVVNTTLKNGVLSNIQIKSSDASTVTLKDITTIQNEVQSTYDASKTMLGCGIIVGDVTSVSNPRVVIQGNWNSYNWVTDTNATNTSNTYSKEIINKALSVSAYQHKNSSGVITVNLGMIVLNTLSMSIDDQRSVKDNYLLSNVEMSLKDPNTGLSGNVNGQVYSVKAGKGNPDAVASDYMPTKNLEYKPYAVKDNTIGGKYDANDGGEDSRYCYWEGDLLKLMYKESTTPFTLDVAALFDFTKHKFSDLDYNFVVTKNGSEVSADGNNVTFTDAGIYVITYKVTDPYNYDKDGNQVSDATVWTFTYEVEVSVAKSLGKNAEINVSSTSFYGYYGKTSSVFDPDFHYCIPFMRGVTITDYADDGVTASTFTATSNIINITVSGDKSSGTVTIDYLDGRKLVVAISGHSVGLGSTGNTISVKSFEDQLWICTDGTSNNATTGTWKVDSYKFTGNNGVTVEYTTTRTCNFDKDSTSNSPQKSWGSFVSPTVDSIKYTVTFDANGGSCTKTFAYATSSSTAVTLPTPTRSGYIFAGWYTAASGGTRVGGAGDSYTPSANITLYAQWGKPCTVTYNANGGSCGTASEKYTGTALTLPTPTRDGYWFIGWYDAAEGGNKIGDAGAAYSPSNEITLYARWQEKVEYTVTYNANGGTCGTASATYQGTALTLPTPTRTGYTFNGWYTAASGGEKIGDAGATYIPGASITLYAQWTAMPAYTITINKQSNATVTVDKTSTYEGDTVSVTVSFSKSSSRTLTVKDASGNTILTKEAAGTYTFTMPASNVTIEASSSDGCVTGDTLVTLADGTQKRIDALDGTEMLLVWDFYKGEYTISPVGAIVNHGYDVVNQVTMRFADGSSIKTLRGHGFYDVSKNKFVIIDEFNIAEYVGHEFVKYDANGNATTTTLVDYSIDSKYEEIWTIVSAVHFNCVLNGILTLSPTDFPNSPAYLMPFEIGEGMKYDEAKMQADIEKYGLYTYEDFAEYCTYEQFVGLNFANWKVAVGKGYINFEDIVWLIETYVN